MNKVCFKCNIDQPIGNFYKHSEMADGRLNKCKECCKSQAKKRHHEKSKDPNWVETERARHREKYFRLNYREKQIEWDKKRPWTNSAVYKNLSRYFNTKAGTELHHWSYKEEHMKDVYLMSPKEHAKAHSILTICTENRQFKTTSGELLTTKKQHYDYLVNNGVSFIEYNAKRQIH